MKRPSKEEYYLGMTLQIAERATCLLRKYGVVIVRDDQIVSTGYNGSPRGADNCTDIGSCPREGSPIGTNYENCRSVHAEMNAIINAARAGVSILGGTMYLHGKDAKTEKVLAYVIAPCTLCKRVIINAGLKELVTPSLCIPVDRW